MRMCSIAKPALRQRSFALNRDATTRFCYLIDFIVFFLDPSHFAWFGISDDMIHRRTPGCFSFVPVRYLDSEEEQRLLKSLDPKRDFQTLPPYEKRSARRNREFHDQYDFVVTLLDTGARHTEISTLEWKSVSLENRTIRLWRPKVRNESVLYMSERLYEVLKRRHSVRDPNIPFVFHSMEGKAKQIGRADV